MDSPVTAGSSPTSTNPPGPMSSRLTLPVVLTGVALVAMSISGAAIALPQMGGELDAAGSALNWVVAGYNLAFAAMTLVAGAAADRMGSKRTLVIASLVFAVGFVCTALAPSILVVDIARIVSGIGGAGVMAAGGALLASSYDGAVRNRAFAYMGTMAGVGIAVGPTLVGVLVTLTGWRGSFVVFAIVGVVVVLGALRLRESSAHKKRIDWIGSALFVTSLSALMFALLEAPALGWTHPAIVGALGAGVIGLTAFAITQRRSTAPVLPPDLSANRGFMGWSLATVTTSVGFLGVLVFLPTYLQAAGGLNPAAAGLAMLLLTAPVLLVPVLAVTLVNRGLSARLLIMVALALVVGGNFGMLVLSPQHTVALLALPLLMIGTGMGASFGITDGQAMSLVPARLAGTAAGFLNTLRGAAEAVTIAAFTAMLLGFLTSRLNDPDQAANVAAGDVSSAQAAAYNTELDAFTESWHLTQVGIGAACLVLSVIVGALLFSPLRRSPAQGGASSVSGPE